MVLQLPHNNLQICFDDDYSIEEDEDNMFQRQHPHITTHQDEDAGFDDTDEKINTSTQNNINNDYFNKTSGEVIAQLGPNLQMQVNAIGHMRRRKRG